ncbi:sugar O-acetyltransferase [Laspinema sp. A4]|nr:sugar O-acetyltransferase [Laspinema sp. D2d]MCT7984507.1 sugar O-acetyltransferase [Laspinema sp. D2d]
MNPLNSNKSMRQRMLAGEPYLATDPELVALLARSQRILHRFNLCVPDATQERQQLIQELFGRIGTGSEVKPPFRCDYGFNIFAGDGLFINYDCVILDCNTVRLGDRVLIGPKVQIYTATHPLNPTERKDGWESALPVEIGSDVWIGGGAIICPGVTIGEGSTIGAGSVVTRDLPPRVVAAGNPCRVIRHLDSESK